MYERVFNISLTLFEHAGYGPEQRVQMAEKHAESTVQDFRQDSLGFDLYVKSLVDNKHNLSFIKNLILDENLNNDYRTVSRISRRGTSLA